MWSFSLSPANADDIPWKTGTLKNVNTVHGTRTHGSVNNGAATEVAVTTAYFTIDADDAVYVLGKHMGKREKPLHLTVNSTVKFGLKKDKYYLMDSDGKTHEVFLETKTGKPKAAEPTPPKP